MISGKDPDSVVKSVLDAWGYSELNPVQKASLDKGLLTDRNLVIAAPTASGKTLIAEIASLDTVRKGKKVVYIVPLKALATEKYEDFKEKYGPLGIRTAISIGDLDSTDTWLAGYDIIIVTSEKMDSLLRHGITWTDSIGLVIADEIHLLDSPGRGPTLEVVLTKLRQSVNPKILGLSATISNYKELAEWLQATPVKSDYRPVKLYSGVYHDGKVNFRPELLLDMDKESPLEDMINQSIEKEKQVLLFVSTRRGAESMAENLGSLIKNKLSPQDRKRLLLASNKILKVLGHPTKQCYRISGCIKDGVAFHHAGLTAKQRSIVENSFKEGVIKAITATPTLAAGINLPAWRVIIRDLKRFDAGRGMDYIPILEIQQMAGRAGRPKYDTEGQAILLTKSEKDARYAWDNYITGEPERIFSKLGVEPVLRTHVLALIASGIAHTKESLMEFFSRTFFAHQYEDWERLEAKLERTLTMLQEYKFIERSGASQDGPFQPASDLAEGNQELKPTRIGRRVSELYIDPMTAHRLISNMGIASERGTNTFGLFQVMAHTLEMLPLLSVRKSDENRLNEVRVSEEKFLVERPPNAWDIEYDEYLASLKTALLFMEWCEEAGEDSILENFRVTPGELRTRLSNADWILYAMQELGLLMGYKNLLRDIRKARLRVKHGAREELLPLIRLRGIGRVRARQLFGSGLKTLESLRKTPLESLERVVGKKVASQVKDQL
jgi:helicase